MPSNLLAAVPKDLPLVAIPLDPRRALARCVNTFDPSCRGIAAWALARDQWGNRVGVPRRHHAVKKRADRSKLRIDRNIVAYNGILCVGQKWNARHDSCTALCLVENLRPK